MKKLRVTIDLYGDSEDDILFGLDEIRKQIDEGYTSGFGSNDSRGFDWNYTDPNSL
jgi:hypothetical protein